MEVKDQLCHAGMKQFYAAQFTDVCSDHYGIYAFYAYADVHHLYDFAAWASHITMKLIHTIDGRTIIIAFLGMEKHLDT